VRVMSVASMPRRSSPAVRESLPGRDFVEITDE
jgi:hypothetical protein